MRRAGAMTAALLLLGGCANGGLSDVGRIGETALNLVIEEEPSPAPGRTPSRAELEALGTAVIAVSAADGPRAFVVPLADNGGYVNYYDARRRGIVLFGGAVARTQGLRYDLMGVRHSLDDPVAHSRPLEAWPGEVTRSYQYRQRDLDAYQITLRCVYARGPRQRIEIVGRSHEVVRVEETCRNAVREVVNTYWVAPETGFVWKSVQWIGPDEPPFTVEIVTPYSAG